MAQKKLSVHSEKLLPIIKKWLYSEKDIFLRELISNASDAITKRKRVLQDIAPSSEKEIAFRIDVKIDPAKKNLTISDNGIGMTSDEVEKYIAQIAFSGAEDFLKNYHSETSENEIIGHFGLGFYSAFMVSKKVDIITQSHSQESSSVLWSCDGSSDYTIESTEKRSIGTDVILYLSPENEEYLHEEKIKGLLRRYCPYLPYPIYVNNQHINNKDPLWLKNPSEISDKEYLSFYHELYPLDPDPFFYVHLNIDFPFHLKGILFFPKMEKNFDMTKSSLRLFCNRVFVSDHCSDLLPDFLSILKG